jgi:5'-3' exonuclease
MQNKIMQLESPRGARGSVKVLIDLSHMAHSCWYPAISAQQNSEKILEEHVAVCDKCQLMLAQYGADHLCDEALKIPKYDAENVFGTYLELKINTIKKGINADFNNWVFCRDSHPKSKYEIYPEYKGTRDKNKFNPIPLAIQFLQELAPAAKWAQADGYEADDVIATLAVKYSKTQRAIVVSGDKDLWQLLRYENIRIFSPLLNEFIGVNHIEKAFSIRDPKLIGLYKALWGDTSDNIKNLVPRMQKNLIPILEKTDGSLESFWEHAKISAMSNRCKELLFPRVQEIEVNWKLVNLSLDAPVVCCSHSEMS